MQLTKDFLVPAKYLKSTRAINLKIKVSNIRAQLECKLDLSNLLHI